MAQLEDFKYFFEDEAFSVTANFTSPNLGNIAVIFDPEVQEVEVGGEVGIEQEVPEMLVETALIPNVKEGSTLTVNSTNYIVKDSMADGTGITRLTLFKDLS